MTGEWQPASGGPPPLLGEIHVWRADLDDDGWGPAAGLPEEERRRAGRIVTEEGRRRWAASRWTLRRILASYTGAEPGSLVFEAGRNGKPRIAGPGPQFNLSHADGIALIAVSGRSVGIDLERCRPRRDLVALAEHGLGPEAAAAVRAAPQPDRAAIFYPAWCRREAIAKCHGGGLSEPDPVGVMTAVEIDAGPGWAAALAVDGDRAPTLRLLAADPRGSGLRPLGDGRGTG